MTDNRTKVRDKQQDNTEGSAEALWREQNAEAFELYNAILEQEGLFSDAWRIL